MDWKKFISEANRNIGDRYDAGVENILDRMGLEPKRSTAEVLFPMLGVFGAGIAVGAALGVLFAPKPGDDLRHELRETLEDLRHRGQERVAELTNGNARETQTRST